MNIVDRNEIIKDIICEQAVKFSDEIKTVARSVKLPIGGKSMRDIADHIITSGNLLELMKALEGKLFVLQNIVCRYFQMTPDDLRLLANNNYFLKPVERVLKAGGREYKEVYYPISVLDMDRDELQLDLERLKTAQQPQEVWAVAVQGSSEHSMQRALEVVGKNLEILSKPVIYDVRGGFKAVFTATEKKRKKKVATGWKRQPALSKEKVAEIRRLRAEGHSYAKIAQKVSCTKATVINYCKAK